MKPLLILLFALTISRLAYAQPSPGNTGKMSITVTGPQQQTLPFATVELLSPRDSSRIAVHTTDSTGSVLLVNISAGNYLLRVSRITYQHKIIPIAHTPLKDGLVKPLRVELQPDNASLKEVVVSGRKQYIRQLADRTVINVDAGISNAGTTVMEFLEKSPGVTVDKDGNISLKGRPNVMVMIDNKPAYVSGADLATLLQSMSSTQIEEIELIDNPSSKYDAAGNAGIINIRTKKNRQRGFNGNLNLSYGQGRYYKTNNSIGLNYRDGAFNFFLNYSMNMNGNFMDMYALRTYYNPDGTVASRLEQPTAMRFKGVNNTLRAGADYYLGKKTTIGTVLTGTNLDRSSRNDGTALWMDAANNRDSIIETYANNGTHWQHAGINLNFRHVFNANSELTADLDLLGYRIRGNQHFQNNMSGTSGYTEEFTGKLPSDLNILSAKADYSADLKKGTRFESGFKTSTISTDNFAEYFYRKEQQWEVDLDKTNHFIYSENIHAVYGNVHKKTERWNMQAGLRYEYTHYDAEQLGNSARKDSSFSRNYSSLFPSAFIGYTIDSSNQLQLSAGRRIDRPPFQKLNPFVFIVNKYTYTAGNPLMRPQYTWNIELTHLFKEKFNTSIGYNYTTDYFSQLFYSDPDGMVVYTEGNLGKMQNLSLSVSGQLNPASWWSVSADLTLNHKILEGFVWDRMTARITQASLNLNNQLRFKHGWSAEVSGYYITKSQNDIQEVVDPTGQVAIGCAKQVLQNKGSIKFSFRDIFYTQAMAGNTEFSDAHEYFKLTRDSRVATISFVYRFGKPLKTPARRNNNGAADEIQRVGSGS